MPSPPMNQKPGKANFSELVSKKIPGGACPRAPLEACSLGPLFRKSVSIYPRSAPDKCSFISAHPGGNVEGLLRVSAFPSVVFSRDIVLRSLFFGLSIPEVWTLWGLLLDIIFMLLGRPLVCCVTSYGGKIAYGLLVLPPSLRVLFSAVGSKLTVVLLFVEFEVVLMKKHVERT